MASAEPVKCGDCGQIAKDTDKGVECEICLRWFHIKCEGVKDEVYRCVKKDQPGIHWYCKVCELGVVKILNSMQVLQMKIDKMEERTGKMENDIEEMKKQMQKMAETMESKVKESVRSECDKNMEATKALLDEGLVRMAEKIPDEGKHEVLWKDIVAREVEDKILVMSADLGMVQKAVEETRDKVAEEADKLNRRNNIIVYNVPESNAVTINDRIKEDKEFCRALMIDVLRVGCEEGEIKKAHRLGKRLDSSKARPLLVEFSDGHVKNIVMENASRLGHAKGKFEGITISHDMTVKEREQCRKLVAEAKEKQQEDESGEYIYKVRGPPGQMKIVKYKKNF